MPPRFVQKVSALEGMLISSTFWVRSWELCTPVTEASNYIFVEKLPLHFVAPKSYSS